MPLEANDFSNDAPSPGPGHHHEIHFFVDGEPAETDQKELTPNQIIKNFGDKDPATHYLVQVGPPRISYQGQG